MSYSNHSIDQYRQPRPRKVIVNGEAVHGPKDPDLAAAGWRPDVDAPIGFGQTRVGKEGAIVETDHVYWPAEYLPIADIAEMKRAEIRAAKDNATTTAIGSESGIHLAMGEADTLINARHDRPLSAEEEATLTTDALAFDVAKVINAKQSLLLAAIDNAEAENDIPGLIAIAW